MVEKYDRQYNLINVDQVRHAPPATHWLLLGERAKHHTIGIATEGYTYTYRGGRAIPTFDVQQANDATTALEDDTKDEEESEEHLSIREAKDLQTTRHSNWRYWISVHVDKLYKPRLIEPQPQFIIKPTQDECIKWLASLPSNANLYLDIETRTDYALLCIGLATETGPVYCMPVYDYRGQLVYSQFAVFWRELNHAAKRCNLVIHNSMFDLVVLGKFYNFWGVKRVYDTMIAQHRICPEAEKSLAHTIAQWTEMPFHKDQFVEPNNPQQETQLYNYNCRDVWSMRLIKRGQEAHAAKVPGLAHSIASGNRMVLPFLINSLQGVAVDSTRLSSIKAHITAECHQLYRMLKMLLGFEINCGSPKQLGDYLYTQMGYPVKARTKTGAPATGKQALYKLLIATNNPAIKLILRLKVAQKKLSMMEFQSL